MPPSLIPSSPIHLAQIYPVDVFLNCRSIDNVYDANLQPNRAYRRSDAVEIPTSDLKQEGEIRIALDYEAHYDLNSTVTQLGDGSLMVGPRNWFSLDYEPIGPSRRSTQFKTSASPSIVRKKTIIAISLIPVISMRRRAITPTGSSTRICFLFINHRLLGPERPFCQ